MITLVAWFSDTNFGYTHVDTFYGITHETDLKQFLKLTFSETSPGFTCLQYMSFKKYREKECCSFTNTINVLF